MRGRQQQRHACPVRPVLTAHSHSFMNIQSSTACSCSPLTIRGDGSYPFVAQSEDGDLWVRNVNATWFGGDHDPDDNGETASGILTRGHPALLGCALPMQGFRATKGSPLPRFPWRTPVEVRAGARQIIVELIDIGPAAPPLAHGVIDLTPAAFVALAGSLHVGSIRVDFRIPGGAQYLPATRQVPLTAGTQGNSAAPIPPSASSAVDGIVSSGAATGSVGRAAPLLPSVGSPTPS